MASEWISALMTRQKKKNTGYAGNTGREAVHVVQEVKGVGNAHNPEKILIKRLAVDANQEN
ncbi:MAG: hypothetical protein R2874_04895 [Desulfobacterales bacterium]